MTSLGFINQVSTQSIATATSLDSIFRYYPNAPIFLSVDGTFSIGYDKITNFPDNIEWLYNNITLGYPPYNKEKVLEWLKREYIGVLKLNTTHFMMLEDDVIITKPITFDPDVECLGHEIIHGNKIHKTLLHEIESFSKKETKTDYYGAGGGSIFKSSTFIENYHKITEYIDKNWYIFEQHYHPQCGYMDCFMVLFYLLCGKDYTPNEKMINLDPHSPLHQNMIKNHTVADIIENFGDDFEIVHGVKHYYK